MRVIEQSGTDDTVPIRRKDEDLWLQKKLVRPRVDLRKGLAGDYPEAPTFRQTRLPPLAMLLLTRNTYGDLARHTPENRPLHRFRIRDRQVQTVLAHHLPEAYLPTTKKTTLPLLEK